MSDPKPRKPGPQRSTKAVKTMAVKQIVLNRFFAVLAPPAKRGVTQLETVSMPVQATVPRSQSEESDIQVTMFVAAPWCRGGIVAKLAKECIP